MANAKFDKLPEELITHIACFAQPSSVLRLSITCRIIRSACYDSLVFKQILIDSQHVHWNHSTLDIEAIASRAGNDAMTWARYAIADEWALHDSNSGLGLNEPRRWLNYLPELFVVKHPLVFSNCWKGKDPYQDTSKPAPLFCLALSILGTDETIPHVQRGLREPGYSWTGRHDSMDYFLSALCTIATTHRSLLKTRLAAWPFNSAARVPHIKAPTAAQIPLHPLSEKYSLPAPFSRRAVDLFGKPTSSFSSWDSWYRLHSLEAFQSPTYLTDGSWCGYYIRFGARYSMTLDPPMIDIQFEYVTDSAGNVLPKDDPGTKMIRATNCEDGVDFFDLRGTMSASSDEVKLVARKQYKNQSTSWDWDCRMTPYGIVGYWGERQMEPYGMKRNGIVWLWKKAWTADA